MIRTIIIPLLIAGGIVQIFAFASISHQAVFVNDR